LELSDKAIELIVEKAVDYGPWFIAFLVFVCFGMRHVAPIVAAFGTIWNERHKTKLSHTRAMLKIENQLRLPENEGKEKRK
jgi:hypothetical protein